MAPRWPKMGLQDGPKLDQGAPGMIQDSRRNACRRPPSLAASQKTEPTKQTPSNKTQEASNNQAAIAKRRSQQPTSLQLPKGPAAEAKA